MKFLWTAVYVNDLDESIAFYSSLVGLKVLRRFPAGPGMEIAFMGNGTSGETMLEFLEDKNNGAVSYTESISVGFGVESMDAMFDLVKERNIPVHSGPMETPGARFFYVKDPNGLNVQFFQQKQQNA